MSNKIRVNLCDYSALSQKDRGCVCLTTFWIVEFLAAGMNRFQSGNRIHAVNATNLLRPVVLLLVFHSAVCKNCYETSQWSLNPMLVISLYCRFEYKHSIVGVLRQFPSKQQTATNWKLYADILANGLVKSESSQTPVFV